MNTQDNRTVRNLVIFSVLVVASGWVGAWVESLLDSSAKGIGQLIWIITPLVVSFLLRAFAGDGWSDLGIRPSFRRNARWYAVSLLVYPIVVILVQVIGFGFGGVTFPGLSQNGFGLFVQAFMLALAPMFLKNIFEEFAWRGYLAPRLYSLPLNTFVAHTVVGLIWAAWHLPYYYIFLGSTEVQTATALGLSTFIPMVFAGAIVGSIAYGEIRRRTNSVWPAVLMHTVGNAFVNTLILLGIYRITDGMGILVAPGVGLLEIALFALLGVGLHRYRQAGKGKSV